MRTIGNSYILMKKLHFFFFFSFDAITKMQMLNKHIQTNLLLIALFHIDVGCDIYIGARHLTPVHTYTYL